MMEQFDAIGHPTASVERSHELRCAMDMEQLKKKIDFQLWVQRLLFALIPLAVVLGVALAR